MASFPIHEKMYLDVIKKYPDLNDHSLAFLLDVFLLKYSQVKNEVGVKKETLSTMRKYFRKYAWKGLLNKEIYWKTRIFYLFQ